MHISKAILIILLFFVSCKKEIKENINIKNINSISNKAKTQNNLEDSLVNSNLSKQKKSIIWENRNNEFYKPTIFLNLKDLYDMTKMNPLEIEDFLIVNNWNIISKKTVEKTKPKRKGKISMEDIINSIDVGTHLSFRNHFNDSEINIFLNKENKMKIDLKTVNVFNYRRFTIMISNENFNARDGGAHENPYAYIGHKTAIGILEPIESTIKIYQKSNFEISSIITTFSPVTFVPEQEKLDFEDQGFRYNTNIKYNLYHFTFERITYNQTFILPERHEILPHA
ncbi:hypothetical protein AAH994_13200 [Weeksellaceae bacterium A-14]